MADRAGVHTGQSSTCTLLPWSHAVSTLQSLAPLSCWNKLDTPDKDHLDGSMRCSTSRMYPSVLNVPSQMCKLLLTWWPLMFFWPLHWKQSGWCFSSSAWRSWDLSEWWTPQSVSDDLGPREVSGASICRWYMTLALHGRVLTLICRCPLLTDAGFLKSSRADDVTSVQEWWRILIQCRLRGHRSQCWFLDLLFNMQRFLQILWTV